MVFLMTSRFRHGGVRLAADRTKAALVIAGKLGDASFYDSANAGLRRAEKELGAAVKVMECNFDPANYVTYIAAAAKNFDLVIVVGFEFIDAIEQVAPKFKKTDFAYFDVDGRPKTSRTSISKRTRAAS
jgi:basic membrane protein A